MDAGYICRVEDRLYWEAWGSGTRVSDSCREEGKSPGARATKFVGALKVAPKLVASDRKIGRSWMLAKFLNFDLCTSSLCNEIIISSYTWKVEWLDLRGSNPVTTLSMHSNMESKQWYMKLSTIKIDTTNTKANKPIVRMGSIFLLTLSSTISAYLYNYLGCPKSGALLC